MGERYKPLYKQLKDKILQDILDQVYKPGDQIPSQNELAKEYGVSRVTVKQALQELVYSGILSTHKGKGTFVEDLPFNKHAFDRLSGFSESIEKIGYQTYTTVLSSKTLAADQRLANKLLLQIGDPVVHLRRTRFVNNVPITLENSYLNKILLPRLDFSPDYLEGKSLYKLLKSQAGLDLAYIEEQINAIVSDEKTAKILKIDAGEPILFVKRKLYANGDQPVEYCENYVRSDIYSIVIRIGKI